MLHHIQSNVLTADYAVINFRRHFVVRATAGWTPADGIPSEEAQLAAGDAAEKLVATLANPSACKVHGIAFQVPANIALLHRSVSHGTSSVQGANAWVTLMALHAGHEGVACVGRLLDAVPA